MNRLSRSISLVLVLALAALVATGCGGGSSEDTLTHEQLVTQLNAICKQGKADRDAFVKSLDKFSNAKDYNGAADAFQDFVETKYRPAIEKTEQLKPSEQDQANFTKYVNTLNQTADLTEEAIPALRKKDEKAFTEAMNKNQTVVKTRTQAAKALGATECGEG